MVQVSSQNIASQNWPPQKKHIDSDALSLSLPTLIIMVTWQAALP